MHSDSIKRERVLPTGETHLVLRLEEEPLRIFEDGVETILPPAVIGGVRSNAYLKAVGRPVASVGVMLKPGACLALFGVSSNELAGGHTRLDLFWGSEVERIAEALGRRPTLRERIDLFERCLAARLPTLRGLHPGLARVLGSNLPVTGRTSEMARRAELGPRRFSVLFREAVGISPKRWLRLRRFQNVVECAGDPAWAWHDLACELGYADQPHLVRDFREFAGITPSAYRALAPPAKNHVPVAKTAASAT